MYRIRRFARACAGLTLIALLAAPAAFAAHGYALWGELKYPPGFAHFDYVNADAPKGGELRLVSSFRVSTFDKYNPFTLKGTAPAYLDDLLFDTLLIGSLDEAGSAYGLLAEDVEVAPDRLSATFRLRPQARFHNGDPVLAADVKHSFDTLTGPYARPAYATLMADVAGADALDERTVRFRFKKPSRELPLTVGALPVFSRQWGQGKPFNEVVMEPPIGSGPYRIGPVRFGKDITYVRDPAYWGRDLNVRRGTGHFDRILVKIYRDNTARLEAFKAGEFDLMRVFSAGDWARRMSGKRFATGELVKGSFRHQLPTGFQSYVLNSRRPALQDARVRQALGLALDYEWMNRRFFYGSYNRVKGLFGNTECAAEGLPDAAQLALMEPLRALFKDEVRAIGRELGVPEKIVARQPFPGPGLGIRVIGEVTAQNLRVLRAADAIVREELTAAGLDDEIWQCPVVLLAGVRSVGVQGDGRTYGHPVVLRPVSSEDAMTADWTRLPYDVLARISTRITNSVPEVNRVVLDCTSKPPGTIEWE